MVPGALTASRSHQIPQRTEWWCTCSFRSSWSRPSRARLAALPARATPPQALPAPVPCATPLGIACSEGTTHGATACCSLCFSADRLTSKQIWCLPQHHASSGHEADGIAAEGGIWHARRHRRGLRPARFRQTPRWCPGTQAQRSEWDQCLLLLYMPSRWQMLPVTGKQRAVPDFPALCPIGPKECINSGTARDWWVPVHAPAGGVTGPRGAARTRDRRGS